MNALIAPCGRRICVSAAQRLMGLAIALSTWTGGAAAAPSTTEAGSPGSAPAPVTTPPAAPAQPPTLPTALPTRSVSVSALGNPMALSNEAALDRLQQQLQLSPEQEDAWRRFVRELDAATGQLIRERSASPNAQEPAPQQISRLTLQMQNRLAALEGIELRLRDLYAQLTPEQQQLANQGVLAALPPLLGGVVLPTGAYGREGAGVRNPPMQRPRRGGMGGGMGGGTGGMGGMRP